MTMPPAIILAGGAGTRLRPLVRHRPKPLALVAGQPFLIYLLRWLAAQGVSEVILCVGYKGRHIQRTIGTGKQFGLRVRYTVERTLRGTGGALRLGLSATTAQTVFVLNGDSFVNISLKRLLAWHKCHGALFTMTVIPHCRERRYGGLSRDRRGFMTSYEEKGGGGRYMNAGVYCIDRRMIARFPRKKRWSLENDFFSQESQKNVLTYLSRGRLFLDIGVPEAYRKSHAFFRHFPIKPPMSSVPAFGTRGSPS